MCIKGFVMRTIDCNSFQRSIVSLLEYPALIISFSLYKGLTSLFFFLNTPLPALVPHFVGSLTSSTCICLTIATTCVMFASVGRSIRYFDNPQYLYAMAVLLIIGICFLCYVVPFISAPVPELTIWLIAVLLVSIGSCAIHIEFGRLMGHLGATYTLIFNIASSLIGLPITAVLLALSLTPRFLISVIFIFLLVYTFLLSVKTIGKSQIYNSTETELTIPWRFLATSLMQGIAVGLVVTLFSQGLSIDFSAQLVSVLVACLASFLFGIALRVDFDRLVYHIGFCGIGAGSLMFALFPNSTTIRLISTLILFSAYIYLDIILWSLGSHLIKNCQQPAIWVASCPSASLMAGRFIGSAIGFDAIGDGAVPANAVVIFSCFAFSTVALYLSSGNNLKNGWGFIKPNDEEGATDREWACTLIAEDFKLTGREREVLSLLAAGKTRTEIADELYVTQNTVKTHVRNLYSKLDVHSNEELMRLIAHQQRAFESH